MVSLRSTIALFLFLSASTGSAGILGNYDEVFVFGDSFSDGGNVALALGPVAREVAPYPDLFPSLVPNLPYDVSDRFSNGPIWADMIGLGPSLAGGTNFSFAGAETGPLPGVTPVPGEVSILQQVTDHFIPSLGGGTASADALYVVAPVGNDIRRALEVFAGTYMNEILFGSGNPAIAQGLAELASADTLIASVTNVATIVGSLAAVGATDFLVFGGADIGLVPAVTLLDSPELPASLIATMLSANYNLLLDQVLATLSLDIKRLDLFALINQIVADPGAFGLANVSDSCIVPDAGACANPDEYFFWDGIHLTTAGQHILADAIRAAVPVPATMLLLLIGLAGFARSARRST